MNFMLFYISVFVISYFIALIVIGVFNIFWPLLLIILLGIYIGELISKDTK